jgi:hypothetical protein
LKLRAAYEGRKLKEVAAEVLRAGLAESPPPALATPTIGKDEKTGLPVVLGGRPARPDQELTPERIAEILIEQEAEWARDAGR